MPGNPANMKTVTHIRCFARGVHGVMVVGVLIVEVLGYQA